MSFLFLWFFISLVSSLCSTIGRDGWCNTTIIDTTDTDTTDTDTTDTDTTDTDTTDTDTTDTADMIPVIHPSQEWRQTDMSYLKYQWKETSCSQIAELDYSYTSNDKLRKLV